MKELQLTKGKVALVDDDDYEKLMALRTPAGWGIPKWTLNGAYAWNKGFGLLHRHLMGAKKGDRDVDHRNGDKLDCRRANMRFCTDNQNQQNRRKKFSGHSQFKGAHWDRSRGFWMARIRVQGKLIYLGVFDTDKEAGTAYNKAATKFFGEFAFLNDMKNTPPSTMTRERPEN